MLFIVSLFPSPSMILHLSSFLQMQKGSRTHHERAFYIYMKASLQL